MPAAAITQAELTRAAKVARATGVAIVIEAKGKIYRVLPAAPDSDQDDRIASGENTCDVLFGVSD